MGLGLARLLSQPTVRHCRQVHGCQMAGYSQIFRTIVFGPFWTMAPLRYAAKFDPFLSSDCTPTPSTVVQSKERKGTNFAIWQHWSGTRIMVNNGHLLTADLGTLDFLEIF